MTRSSSTSSSESNPSATPPLEKLEERHRWNLFEAFGIELEYMIVQQQSLDVLPICDAVLHAESGAYDDAEHADISWSNELVLHVIELKTADPVASLGSLAGRFQDHVGRVRRHVADRGGRLLPTAMHPWMDPYAQTRLWPHGNGEIYAAFDRIFNCKGHGWSNLQSMHINLPFRGDEQFARLHSAIRIVLPLLPALAASSPIMDGGATGLLDNRLNVYRHNCARIPQCVGRVIPESIGSEEEYESRILAPIHAALRPLDTEEVLEPIWCNARGAIARFDRGSIEIRLIDVQESPAADLAIASLVSAMLKMLCEERFAPQRELRAIDTESLASLLTRSIRSGPATVVEDEAVLRVLGRSGPTTAGVIWSGVLTQALRHEPKLVEPHADLLKSMLRNGCLAQRILRAVGNPPTPASLREVYHQLADCLDGGRSFGMD